MATTLNNVKKLSKKNVEQHQIVTRGHSLTLKQFQRMLDLELGFGICLKLKIAQYWF
jgi:hypothetical protein